jgi:two-component system, NarL family, response regulator LiaR
MASSSSEVKVRVAVVEANPVERQYLLALVERAPGLVVSAAYGSLEGTASQLENDQPDLVLIDLDGLIGFETEWLRKLRGKLPHTALLVLSSEMNREQVFNTLEAGVSGWLQKPCTPDQIVRALLAAHEGGAVLSNQVARQILDYFHARGTSVGTLTAREREVLSQLGQGTVSADIVARLGITNDTFRTHVRSILVKLNANSRAEALAKYLNPAS